MSRNSLGFTLLELLVVFSVIGILSGIGFASFVSYSKKQAIDQATQDLKTAIDQAKFNAISRIKPTECGSYPLDRYRVIPCTNASNQAANCPSGSTDLYYMDAVCVDNTTGIGTTSNPILAKKKPSNIIISINPGECSNGVIRFYPLKNGTDISGYCRIVITTTDTTLERTLCVDSGGNVSIKEGNSTTPATCP